MACHEIKDQKFISDHKESLTSDAPGVYYDLISVHMHDK